MKRLVALLIAATMFAGCLVSCDGGSSLPPTGTTSETKKEAPETRAPDETENVGSTAVTEPDETDGSTDTDEERQPSPGPSTLWGNNLDEPGRVRTPGESKGDFHKGASDLVWGSKLFYLYLGSVWMQDVNDPQPMGKLVYKDKASSSGGGALMVVDAAATAENRGEPVLLILYSPLKGRSKIVSVNTGTGEERVIRDGISGVLSSFSMYKDTLYYATFMMNDGAMEFYYTMYSVKKDGSDYAESDRFEASPLWQLEWISGDRIYCSDGNAGHIVSYDLSFGNEKKYEGLVSSVDYVDDEYIYYTAGTDKEGTGFALYRGNVNDPSDARLMMEITSENLLGYYNGSLYYDDVNSDVASISGLNLTTRQKKKVYEPKYTSDDVMLVPAGFTDTYMVYIAIYRSEDEDMSATYNYGHMVCADFKTGDMWKIQY